jgi:nicotinamidase-related amidase
MRLSGKLGPNAVHVAVDLQRLFSEPTSWHVEGLAAILPNVVALVEAMPGRTLFTRFMVPMHAHHMPGQWRRYYERWAQFTGANLPPHMLDLVEAIERLASPASKVDKLTYSAFEVSAFEQKLRTLNADTLIFTGVETDVCVLGTLLPAIDRGYRVVAVEDAMASSSPQGHAATLRHVLPRFDEQVEIAATADVLAALR